MVSKISYGILCDGQLKPATALEWERWWFTKPDERLIAHSWIGEAKILTVCLGIMPPGRSFRTEASGGLLDGAIECYTTLEEAMIGHERMFGRVEYAWHHGSGS